MARGRVAWFSTVAVLLHSTVAFGPGITECANCAECVGAKHIRIPEGVTKIEAAAFELCTQLETVVIPSTVRAAPAWSRCAVLCPRADRAAAAAACAILWYPLRGCDAHTGAGVPKPRLRAYVVSVRGNGACGAIGP